MFHAALLVTGLLATLPGGPPPTPRDLETYEALRNKAGKDATAQVKLALWCEAHGLDAERLRHLSQAVLTDPGHAMARGLLGLVRSGGRWGSPQEAGDRIRADEKRAAVLAEYNRRRDELEEQERALLGPVDAIDDDARSEGARERSFAAVLNAARMRLKADRDLALRHANLGTWCRDHGLEPEALAHFTTAVHLDPRREASWRNLGYVRRHGRWASPEQAVAEEKDERAQRQADRHWGPLLRKWKGWLAVRSPHREQAEAHLAAVTDPRAIPALREVFATRSEDDQCRLVDALGRIDDPRASRAMAEMAVRTTFTSVRATAIEALRKRPRRDYAGELVGRIRDKIAYAVRPVEGPGSRGVLVVDTSRVRVVRSYDAPPAFRLGSTFRGYVGYDASGLPLIAEGIELDRLWGERNPIRALVELRELEERSVVMIAAANLQAEAARQRMAADIKEIEMANQAAEDEDPRLILVLREAAGAPPDLKEDETSWNVWWYDTLGYRYSPPPRVTITEEILPYSLPPTLMTCFAAGTPVRTLDGPRPIEAIRVGDQVLAQDTSTGALGFHPVVFVHHNPPGKTLRVAFDGGDSVVCSVYHRFWRANSGWAMARELRPGDVLRTLGGLARVSGVEPDATQPLYNLDVHGPRTFFAGAGQLLVHDNTLPDHRLRPFDALPVVEAGRPE